MMDIVDGIKREIERTELLNDMAEGMTEPKSTAMLTAAQSEIERLRKIEAAAKNLVAQKGRHHTQQAYEKLAALVVPNDKLRDAIDG